MADDARIQELLEDYGHALTSWEEEFLTSLDDWEGDLTPAQADKLDEVYARVRNR